MARASYAYTNFNYVRNVYGSSYHRSRDSCGCASWEEHWRRATKSQRTTCSRNGCSNYIEVGAHVEWSVKVGRRTARGIYIVGLCRACNMNHNEDYYYIDSRVRVADPSPQATCRGW